MNASLSRRAGRWWGRWLRRNGPALRARSEPARRGTAVLLSYVWLIGYIWIGTIMAVGLSNLVGVRSPVTLIVGAGGGSLIGWWLSRHRLQRVDDPDLPPPRRVGLLLLAWLAVLGLSLLLGTPTR